MALSYPSLMCPSNTYAWLTGRAAEGNERLATIVDDKLAMTVGELRALP